MPDVTQIFAARILIVDDKESNILLLETMLRNAGYQHITACMQPRLVCALHEEQRFDLILLDLQMPEMDGFEVMQGLQLLEPESYLPVLVITAQPGHKLRALQAGAKDFISKPFDLIEVQTRIHNMLEVRLLYQKVNGYAKELEQTVLERTAQLRASEARFKSFTELSSDWYWEQDAQGKFTEISGPVLEMLGMTSTAIPTNVGQTEQQMPLPDSTPLAGWNDAECEQLHANIAARKPFLDLVYRRNLSDGSTQYLQVSGEPMFDQSSRFIGYRGVGAELRDRRRPDQEQINFRAAVGLLSQAIILLDPLSMHVLDANETLCRITGYSRAELFALTPSALNLGSLEQLQFCMAQLRQGKAVAPIQIQLHTKRNERLILQLEWRMLVMPQPIAVAILQPEPSLAWETACLT
ncbi:MAG: response regulator [Burkholderiales bacterium]|nr:response regulator [Burkholderiales bacterium]